MSFIGLHILTLGPLVLVLFEENMKLLGKALLENYFKRSWLCEFIASPHFWSLLPVCSEGMITQIPAPTVCSQAPRAIIYFLKFLKSLLYTSVSDLGCISEH